MTESKIGVTEQATPKGSYDDELLELSKAIPDFGGLYVEGGALVVRTGGQLLDEHGRSALTAFMARREGSLRAAELISDLRVKTAAHTFEQLVEWCRRVSDANLPDLYLLDADEVNNVVAVGVGSGSLDEVRKRLIGLGIPVGALDVFPSGPVQPDLPALTSKQRPTLPGYELATTLTGSAEGCTLGWTARRSINGSPMPDTTYFITSAHCTTQWGLVNGNVAGQPSLASGDLIGVEVFDATPFTRSLDPACPIDLYCRYSEAAFFRYNAGIGYQTRAMAYTSNGTVVAHNVPEWSAGRPVGTAVYKTGRVTGTTGGTVTRACFQTTTTFTYAGRQVYLLCQWEATYASTGGDSGSPVVVNIPGRQPAAAGMHWGRFSSTGYGVYSDIYQIEKDTSRRPDGSYYPSSFVVGH
ncbi:MAG: hypothetical protein H7Y22_04215 [Gemmatimonadaceae bacterium]|nr:hypothetical protein [Gloeobacterales cyanobacterium ES-bin-141]